jgi:hypothetical protein
VLEAKSLQFCGERTRPQVGTSGHYQTCRLTPSMGINDMDSAADVLGHFVI